MGQTETMLRVPVASAEATRWRTFGWATAGTIAAFPLLFLLALTFAYVINSVAPAPGLDSFRVGNLALTGDTKTGEAAFPLSLFAMLIAVAATLSRIFVSKTPSVAFRSFLILELVLAAPVILQTVLGLGTPIDVLIDSPVLTTVTLQVPPAILILSAWLWRKRSRTISPVEITLPYLLLSATVALSSLGIVTAVRFVAAPFALTLTMSTILWISVSIGLLALVLCVALSSRVSDRASLCFGFTIAGLTALPLLAPPLLVQNGLAASSPGANSGMWKLALAVLGIFLVVEMAIRWFSRHNRSMWTVLPSFSVAALLVPLRASYSLPMVPRDDYHFGELFAPFALWRESGQLPFIDVFLPRGILLNILPGFVNAVLNDGSAAALAMGTTIIAFIAVVGSHLVLRRAIGLPFATAAVALMAVSNAYIEGDLLVTAAFIGVLAYARKRPSPFLLGPVIIVVNVVAVLAYPMMGIVSLALTFLVLVVALAGALLSRSAQEIRYGFQLLAVSLALTVAALLSPAGKMLIAAVVYVIANGTSNTEAFGVSLNRLWMTPFGIGQILAFAFVLGIFVSAWLVWKRRRDLRSPSWNHYFDLALAVVPAAFVATLIGRYLGRVDPVEWSVRPAAGTLLVLGLVVPAAIFIVGGRRARKVGWYSVGIAAIVSVALIPVNEGGLLRSSLGALAAPSSWASAAYTTDSPRLGQGMGDTTQMSGVAAISAIAHDLPPREPVLNLSNRGALFGYMEWQNPIPYLAAYNIESTQSEELVIEKLHSNPPQYVFVGPGPQWDGVSLALRNPLLTQWMIKNYTPLDCGDTTWATLGVGLETTGPGALDCPTGDAQLATTDELWTAAVGAPVDLDMIPASWGSRAADFELGNGTVSASDNSASRFDIRVAARSDQSDDLLLIAATCRNDPSADAPSSTSLGDSRASVSWGDSTEMFVSRFEWGSGRFVIPLDAYPSWTSAPRDMVTIEIPQSDCKDGWALDASFAGRP